MIKMGQKRSKQETYQKKVEYLLKRRKVAGKGIKRANLRHPRPHTYRQRILALPKLVKRADTVFSLFIRKRDGRCVLCGSTVRLTNGHLIKRGKKAVRWSEGNCFCLCSTCNYRDKVDTNYHGHYVRWFVERFGIEAYARLEDEALREVDSAWIRQKATEVIEKYG